MCVRGGADSDEQEPDEVDQAELAPPQKHMLHLYGDDLDSGKQKDALCKTCSSTQAISVNCFFCSRRNPRARFKMEMATGNI